MTQLLCLVQGEVTSAEEWQLCWESDDSAEAKWRAANLASHVFVNPQMGASCLYACGFQRQAVLANVTTVLQKTMLSPIRQALSPH